MKYTLSQLLKDKKLRIALTKGSMTFADDNGVFALDFATQPLRGKCQRTVFEKLYALGGEELFKGLLDGGNTNLTRDPNASNAGMVSVAGAEGWYLKTNVGDPSALASILFGIAGWAEMSGDFDGELVSICDGSEEPEKEATVPEKKAEKPAEEADLDEEDEESFEGWRNCLTKKLLGEALPLAEYSLASKNGHHVFYDDVKKQFVTFTAQLGGVERTFEEMLECERLVHNAYYGDWDDTDCGGSGGADAIYGYRYRVEKDGKWGFISAGFTKVLAPQFDGLKVVDSRFGKELLAWSVENENLQLWEALPVEAVGEQRDWWLQPVKSSDGYLEDDNYYFDKEHVPAEDAYYEFRWDEEEKSTYRLYFPSVRQGKGYYWNEDAGDTTVERVTCQNGVLNVGAGNMCYRIPYMGLLDLFAVKKALEEVWNRQDGFELVFPLESQGSCSGMGRLAVVRRDGYWAVARLAPKRAGALCNGLEDMLTPFAFTKIDAQNVWENQVVVDRFGKKGVFDYEKREYVVPCEYESVKATNTGFIGYIVEKAGFKGSISRTGNWVAALHR